MEELQALFFVSPALPVTPYGLCVAIAAAAGLALYAFLARKRGIPEKPAMIFSLLCLPFGLLGARIVYCLARLDLFLAMGLEAVLRLTDGGYALWGAVGGVSLAAVTAAKMGHSSVGVMLDGIAAPGMLALALCRFAEYFSGEGYGLYVENEAFQFFPLAVNKFGDWRWAVFMLEGAAALAICGIALGCRQKRPGDRARLTLILFCASQIILESLRQDSFLRWEVHFIRLSELPAVALLAILPVAALIRRKREGAKSKAAVAVIYALAFLVFVGIFIWMEFAVQKSATLPVWTCYTIEAICCAVMGAVSWRVTFKN